MNKETTQFEQFLRPLIEGIVLTPNITIDVTPSEGAALATVIVQAPDQKLIIGKRGRNIIALQALFKEWCLSNYQVDGELAVLEPSEQPAKKVSPEKEAERLKTKENPASYLKSHAEWLISELFPQSYWDLQLVVASTKETALTINLDRSLGIELSKALTHYLRALGMNHGVSLQIYIRRHDKSGASAA